MSSAVSGLSSLNNFLKAKALPAVPVDSSASDTWNFINKRFMFPSLKSPFVTVAVCSYSLPVGLSSSASAVSLGVVA